MVLTPRPGSHWAFITRWRLKRLMMPGRKSKRNPSVACSIEKTLPEGLKIGRACKLVRLYEPMFSSFRRIGMNWSPSRYSPSVYPCVAMVMPRAIWLRVMPMRWPFICE